MREFDRPIGRVWRRMRMQRFLAALVWSLGACLLLAATAIAVEKLAQRPLPGPDWVPFAAAGGLAVLIAGLVALLTGPSRVDAAVAIDRAFHLNERLSTVLTLPGDLRETPAGRALVSDTLKHIGQLDIPAQFGLRLPRRSWVPVVPAIVAAGLLFLPEWVQQKARASRANAADPVKKEDVVKITKAVSKALEKKREQMDKGKFPEAESLLAELQKAAEKLANSPPADKDKAMVELNKLSDALKDREKQLGGADQIAKQLKQLQQMKSGGPADEFAKDLARGDYDKAAQDMKSLQEKLAKGEMTEADKKALQEQLGEMKQQLEKLANLEERKKQLEEAKKNGGLTKEQFEQQMAKLNDQAKDLKKLQKMSEQLAQAQQALQQGDTKKAAEALGMSEQQLQQLADQAAELEMLDSALADLQDAKNGMANDGMNQLGKQLDGANSLGMGDGMNPGNGNGLGRGRGQGDRPEAEDRVSAYNTKVKQQYGKGKAILEGFAPPSKQMKGDSIITEQEAIETATGIAAEALTNQKVPRSVQKHVTGYFDQIRKGE